jgi:hypothetical protein
VTRSDETHLSEESDMLETNHSDHDPPEEIGGVPGDEEIGGVPVDSSVGELPPVDVDDDDQGADEYGEPVEPRIPRKRKAKVHIGPTRPDRPQRWPFFMIGGCIVTCCLCWLTCCAIVVAAGGAAAWMANNEVTEDGTAQLTIETDDVITLSVDNPTGRVRVRPGSSDEVNVEYTKKAFGLTKGQAQSGLEDISVTLDNEDGPDQFAITVDKGSGIFRSLDHVDMTVYVPQDVHLAIDANTGEIDVQDVNAHSLNLSADTGAVTFDGSLEPDASAHFSAETKTGKVVVKLPSDAYVSIDASTDTGSVDVAHGFDNVRVEREDNSGPSESWLGVLGEGNGSPPALRLRSNTGAIVVEVQ